MVRRDQETARVTADPAPSSEPAGGYRKGGEARRRILEAALQVFAAAGFKGATTRQIAELAGVNLPALKYYFGGKAGLYLACAEEILGRYQTRMLDMVAGARAALDADLSPDQARARLKTVMETLADMMLGGGEAEVWSAFMLREVGEQGAAFDLLYERLWAPGVEVAAGLIARALGETAARPADRIQALLLISSLSAFGAARPVALKLLDWPDARGERMSDIKAALVAQVDRLGR
ncbi:CerR family C-terminal domain-containing protein [Phenylobacterium aquaticum]|uniref:CerR family C-terminal domain-containing protein n=1 Tax=Phenylobacterium aquaticum TaxID=1763816 RepID=UPI001F5D90C1|nr:CerR family C-terminal domain-containing protein [Phenylobacterium aquaticum]MCI3132487.1 CerR family C-terminal domain-containing protein [Phenylobacterium aquaticum]